MTNHSSTVGDPIGSNGASRSRSVGSEPSSLSSPLLVSKTKETVDRLKVIESMVESGQVPYHLQMQLFGLIRKMDTLMESSNCPQSNGETTPLLQRNALASIGEGPSDWSASTLSQRNSDRDARHRTAHVPPSIEFQQRRFNPQSRGATRPANARTPPPRTVTRQVDVNQRRLRRYLSTRTLAAATDNQSRSPTAPDGNSPRNFMAGMWRGPNPDAQHHHHEGGGEGWKRTALEAFEKLDKDGDGYLDESEVQVAISLMQDRHLEFDEGFNAAPQTYVRELMEQIDADGDGKIDQAEFVQMMGKAHSASPGTRFLSAQWKRTQEFARNVFLDQQQHILDNTIGSDKLLHPMGGRNIVWNLIISFMSFVLVFTLPLSLGWMEYGDTFLPLNIIIEILFVLDIFKNFFTGYEDRSGLIVMDKRKARRRYMRGSFLFDLLGSLPFDTIFFLAKIMNAHFSVSVVRHFLRALKILRSLKLLTLRDKHGKISEMFKQMSFWFDSTFGFSLNFFGKIIRVVYWTLIISHWMGCLQFMIVRLSRFPEESWVVYSGLENESPRVQWAWSLYKALCQMINIGFETPPFTNTSCDTLSYYCQWEHWATLICLYVGVGMYTYLLSSMLFVLQTTNFSHKIYEEKLSELEVYMKQKNLPLEMREAIRDYYYTKHPRKQFCNDAEVLSELPSCYIDKIKEHLTKNLRKETPLLQDNPKFAEILGSMMVQTAAGPGEVIFKEHAPGDTMYFIGDGVLHLSSASDESGEEFSHAIGPGCFFGEGALLLTDGKRTMTATTGTHCVLFEINKTALLAVLECFPQVGSRLYQTAQGRLRRFRHAKNGHLYPLEPGDEGGDSEDSKTTFFMAEQMDDVPVDAATSA